LIGDVYGVVKAYTTRVGDGPFPTEQLNVSNKQITKMALRPTVNFTNMSSFFVNNSVTKKIQTRRVRRKS